MNQEQSTHPLDWNAKLVRFFLDNSRLVWLMIFGLVVGGAFSLLALRREGFPEVSPKIAIVQTLWPGATPEEVENQITKDIEAAVREVNGLKETSSTSANSFSNVVVTLDESVDLETALQDVQSKVQAVRSQLPVDAEAPKVQTFSTGGSAFTFGVTRVGATLEQIRTDARLVADELSDVSGVKSAEVANDADERIVIAFRPADLEKAGITLQVLQQLLQGSNVTFPIGSLELDGREQSVVSVGAFTSVDDIRDIVLGFNPTLRKAVRLSDVADVQLASERTESFNRFGYRDNGQLASHPGLLVDVQITNDSDIIRTRTAIEKHLEEKRDEGAIPSEIKIVTLNDQAESTEDQIDEIVSGAIGSNNNLYLLGGLQLLFLAMLLFVNWRAALVAALAIPFSLFFTFISLALFGVQLNTIVLFSLILVLGLIVDPAIVMVEAIQRYRDLKYNSREAVLESGRRYGASLFMAVLTSVIVFFPFGVVSGIFGEIIKFIPLTVVPALVASYLVPIALLPYLSRWLLRTHAPAHHDDGKAHEVEGLSRAAEWFMAVNRAILAKRWRQIATLVVAAVLVVGSLAVVGSGQVQVVQFSNPEDNQFLSIDGSFPNGLTKADRDAAVRKVEELVQAESGVDHYFYFSESRDGFYLFVELALKAERKDAADRSKAIVARLREATADLPNLDDVQVNEVSSGPPAAAYQIQIQLNDNDPAVLERAAKDVGQFLASQATVTKVDDGYSGRGEPQVAIRLDRVKVQERGLSSFEIGQQLKAILDETEVTKLTTADSNRLDVVLVSASVPTKLDEIRALPLVTRSGQVVRVRDIATVEPGTSVDAIQRFDGQRFVNVKARVDGNNTEVFKVQAALNDYLSETKLRELGVDSTGSRGEFDDIAKSFQQLGVALVVAILLTYLVLVIQFKSFSQPMIMLVTVPLSFIGVFPALWFTGSDLGFLELLGVTILVGIVENVAIFLLDYANQLVNEQGMTPRDAIIQATGVRFRPILLTKLVALGGLLPLAIESEFWRGLAVTIIAGIGLSGFLSLLVIPILYVWIEGFRRKFHSRMARTS